MTDYRFKCCVGITPVNFGQAQGADYLVINYLPSSVEEAKKMTTDPDIIEATEYYKIDRGKAQCGATSCLFSFNSAALASDAFSHAEVFMIRPFIAVTGDISGGFGAYRDAHEIHGRAGSKEKAIIMLSKVSHHMLYDEPNAVKAVLHRLLPFFENHLRVAE
ncbi:hypothetical protein F1880_002345 [Penicillium rolfsii]|nr:hypothetical protein F1880_002345 [Penicillium rolfsii]